MREKISLYLDLIRWNRPAGWLLLLWPTLSALWVASGGFPGWHLLAVFTLGTILMRSAGCCLNDVADRDFDKHVKRTAERPVTSGRIGVKEALLLGAVLALIAFMLVLTLRTETIAWSFAAMAVAVAYPYAKRFIAMPQAVLGVAFSFGIPMAFAAVTGEVPSIAWALLLGNLFWVLAYDTEYAMVDRDDDLRIGMKTSAITLGQWDVAAVMFFLCRLCGRLGRGARRTRQATLDGGFGCCCTAGRLAFLADQRPITRRLLQSISLEPLGGFCRLCGRGTQLPLSSP